LFRKVSTTALACTLILTLVNLESFLKPARAQHIKVPKEPFQVLDASTGKTVSEVLVIPLYSSYKGVFIAPEGPSKATVHIYLDSPFVYHAGEPFVIKQPRVFTGLPLILIFIGEGNDLDGILVIAPGYRPLWTEDLWWYPGLERMLQLNPIPDREWSLLLERELSPFLKGASRINDNCQMWDLPERCNLKVRYSKKERELVRSFLQHAPKAPK
jgi:hypothetical protein